MAGGWGPQARPQTSNIQSPSHRAGFAGGVAKKISPHTRIRFPRMIGRSVGTSLTRLPLYARLPFRPAAHQCTLIAPSRSYATPGRPRSTVGEPSRPIKRAVKRAAKTPSTDDAASKKTAAKKKTAAAKKKKAAPAKERRAPLTPEQKQAKLAAKKARTEKERIKELKKIALDPPKHSPLTAFNVYTAEKLKENSREGSDKQPAEYRETFKAVTRSWADRTPADIEVIPTLHPTMSTANRPYSTTTISPTPTTKPPKPPSNAGSNLTLSSKLKPRTAPATSFDEN